MENEELKLGKVFKIIGLWFNAGRGYTLPMSILSWLIPFLYAILYYNGMVDFGLIALAAIVILHWSVNLLDDLFDWWKAQRDIKLGKRQELNFQRRKCIYLINGDLTFKQALIGLIAALSVSLLIALWFISVFGLKLLPLIIITGLLCLSYPILDHFALSEVVIGIVFAPLLYYGVFYVMTGTVSLPLMLMSISTGLMTIGLSYTHILLDCELDRKNSKTTLATLFSSPLSALNLQTVIILLAYLNIIICICFAQLPILSLLTLLSIPTAVELYRILKIHLTDPEQKIKRTFFMGFMENWKNIKEQGLDGFMIKFLTSRNLMVHFTLLLAISLLIDKVI